jgi:dihydrofolate synthase/folylpolyglutamate synthase
VIGEYTAETKGVFVDKAQKNNAEIYFASDLIFEKYPSDLLGDYQEHNKKTVLQTVTILSTTKNFKIDTENVKKGLLKVVENTGLQGRWQQLRKAPKTICDTAHNKNGLEIVFKQLSKEKFDHLHIVFGVVNDKNLDDILPLLPKDAIYYFSKPNNPRGLDAEILAEQAAKYNLKGSIFNSITAAYQQALESASETDFIFIGGSTFVVAEIL